MPAANPKNMALSPAASDLGLGNILQQQLEDTEEERRKKLLQQSGQQMRSLGNSMNGMGAVSTLGIGMGG